MLTNLPLTWQNFGIEPQNQKTNILPWVAGASPLYSVIDENTRQEVGDLFGIILLSSSAKELEKSSKVFTVLQTALAAFFMSNTFLSEKYGE